MGRTLTGKAIYPAADYRPVPGWETTGVLTDTENLKLVWHKTQGSSDPYEWYKQSGGVPHLTLQRDGTLDQHYFFSHFSRALKNLAGGIETNRECIQVEVVGWVGTEATDAQLETIVALIQWCNGTLGIPTVWPLGRPRGAADHGPHRDSVFDHTAGQYGHSQAGEQDHADPCWTDREWSYILDRTGPIVDDMDDSTLDSRDVYKKLAGLETGDVHPLVGVWQEYLRDVGCYTGGIDSTVSEATWRAHEKFERKTYPSAPNPDYRPGRKSWAALRNQANASRTQASRYIETELRTTKLLELLDEIEELFT